MRLSIAMIVKNEEKYLEKCLLSTEKLKNIIDYELIIVDTGSIDNTINIAQKYTSKVYTAKWNDDFSSMRNLSISYCCGDWVLILDADEVLQNPDELINILSEKDIDNYNSIGIYQKNYLNGNDANNYEITDVFRLLKRNKNFKFEGTIHEQPNIIYPKKNSSITLEHYGYNNSSLEKKKYRNERNKKLLEKELKYGEMDKIYVLFQLARTYINEHENSKSKRYITHAYNMDKESTGYHLPVLKQFIYQIFLDEEYKKCIEILDEVKQYFIDDLDYYYINAVSFMKLNMYEISEEYYVKYFKLWNQKKKGEISITVTGEDSLKTKDGAEIDYIKCLFMLKKYNELVKIYNLATSKFTKKEVVEEYLYSLVVTEKYNLWNDYLSEIHDNEDMLIENIANTIDKLYSEDFEINNILNNTKNDFISKYINTVYFEKSECNLEVINFNEYYIWKARIIKKYILKEGKNLEYIECLNLDDTYEYVLYLNRNYNIIEILLNYEKDNFLCEDSTKNNLTYVIQKVLLSNKLIVEDKFESLAKRTLVSNAILLEDFLKGDSFSLNIMDKYSLMWIYIFRLLKKINSNKAIVSLKRIIQDNNEYTRIVDYFVGIIPKKTNFTDVDNNEISKEKTKILNLIEKMIYDNQINDALNVTDELCSIYPFDGQVLLYKGVILYTSGDIDKSLLYLSLAYVFSDDKFEALYNIAMVLESNNIKLSNIYYKKAYNICSDEKIKEDIEVKIKSVDKIDN